MLSILRRFASGPTPCHFVSELFRQSTWVGCLGDMFWLIQASDVCDQTTIMGSVDPVRPDRLIGVASHERESYVFHVIHFVLHCFRSNAFAPLRIARSRVVLQRWMHCLFNVAFFFVRSFSDRPS